jgi:hypothetical protein
VLFSPIGSNDPYSSRKGKEPGANQEGSVLTVLRSAKPERACLFYNTGVEGNMEQAGKDTADIIAAEFPRIVITHLPQRDFSEPHIYDAVYPLIDSALANIANEVPDAEITLNISSGTPAMKAALLVIHTLDKYSTKAYQVSDRDENRVSEVEKYHSLANEIRKGNIIKLIENYEYVAALRLVEQSSSIGADVLKLISGCVARMNIDAQQAAHCFVGTDFGYDRSAMLSEYLWMLEVRLHKQQWADFIRGVSPAITELMLVTLRKELPDSDWLRKLADSRSGHELDIMKIKANERLMGALGFASSAFPKFASNDMMMKLIEEYCVSYIELPSLKDLRKMERKIRNVVAHQIEKIDKDALEKQAGLSMDRAMRFMFELANVKPGLYQRINRKMIDILQTI